MSESKTDDEITKVVDNLFDTLDFVSKLELMFIGDRLEKLESMETMPDHVHLLMDHIIDYRYIDSILSMYGNSKSIFEDSKYKPLMFKPEYNWHFQKPEPYKHFFLIFSEQVRNIPNSIEKRINFFKISFRESIDLFKEIIESGVYLDENSDGSHLNFWLTALNRYEKYLKGYQS